MKNIPERRDPLRIALIGAAGRMGEAVLRAAVAQKDVVISAKCERGNALEPVIAACDVVLDFSHADATDKIVHACLTSNKPLVVGTTGQSAAQLHAIEEAAQRIPILQAANFSAGVNTLFWLTRKAAEILGPDFDLEIVEAHHRWKKDAPSGTAKRLAKILGQARSLDSGKITTHSLRAGDIVGDHTVIFAALGERLELTHRASSRETFAVGALRAALWLAGKPPRLYNMEDVLSL